MSVTIALSSILTLFSFVPPVAAQSTDILNPTQDNLFMADVIHWSTTYSPPAAKAIMWAGRAKTIQGGHQVCSMLDEGSSVKEIYNSIMM